jgi:hypothetical protein
MKVANQVLFEYMKLFLKNLDQILEIKLLLYNDILLEDRKKRNFLKFVFLISKKEKLEIH